MAFEPDSKFTPRASIRCRRKLLLAFKSTFGFHGLCSSTRLLSSPTIIIEMPKSPFRAYARYVLKLRELAAGIGAGEWDLKVHAALNGQASEELRRIASLKLRRRFGAFFTGTELSSKLLGLGTAITSDSIFYDPTCGMGDLLVAAAKILPIADTLPKTLRQWGKQLSGIDLHPEFVEGTKTRLTLLARQRHNHTASLSLSPSSLFPKIRVGDGRVELDLAREATHLVLNPPFGQVPADSECGWASGRMTEAAGFVIRALEQASPKAEILAILPDVLRSGTFSARWRDRVDELASVDVVQPFGVFDDNADVDVFLVRLRRASQVRSQPSAWLKPVPSTETIGTRFDVHVGSVVPHRDPKKGLKFPYIHARSISAWKTMTRFVEFRRHLGRAFDPPFVVVRRTSRPDQPSRAVATVIDHSEPIAVENHLLVCLPKDGSVKTCKKLMEHLKTQPVNDFLNDRIRCRHLTVGVVKEIPWMPYEE